MRERERNQLREERGESGLQETRAKEETLPTKTRTRASVRVRARERARARARIRVASKSILKLGKRKCRGEKGRGSGREQV